MLPSLCRGYRDVHLIVLLHHSRQQQSSSHARFHLEQMPQIALLVRNFGRFLGHCQWIAVVLWPWKDPLHQNIRDTTRNEGMSVLRR